jgi:hypothetical protein
MDSNPILIVIPILELTFYSASLIYGMTEGSSFLGEGVHQNTQETGNGSLKVSITK